MSAAYALIVAYDGALYRGFQMQNDGPTVQGVLESALSILARHPVRVSGSGRTDSGVHATGQVVGFILEEPVADPERFLRSLNGILRGGVQILRLIRVPLNFHPRFSCLAREYEYLLWTAPGRPVHLAGKCLPVTTRLDLDSLNGELAGLIGEGDFAAFTREEYRKENTFRYIDTIELSRRPDAVSGEDLVVFRIRGNAFLHNMIRILVGTVLDRARGKIPLTLKELQESGDRKKTGTTAPPDGLFFRHAYYPPVEGVEGLKTLTDYPVFAPRVIPGGSFS